MSRDDADVQIVRRFSNGSVKGCRRLRFNSCLVERSMRFHNLTFFQMLPDWVKPCVVVQLEAGYTSMQSQQFPSSSSVVYSLRKFLCR
jgi:hypothetical protein